MRIAHISDLHLRHHLPGTSAISRRLSRRMPALLQQAVAAIAAHQPDLVAVTGDLVDHPFHAIDDPEMISLGEKDLRLVGDLFAPLSCPVALLYGNHDRPELFRRVFADVRTDFDVGGYRVLAFFDEEVDSHYPQRMLMERQRFLDALCDDDPRPQIHLQHYLTAPTRNRHYPHTYREAASMRQAVVADPRVRLVLSGHYHRGARVLTEGQTKFSTVPAFCEPPHPYRVYTLTDRRVEIRNYMLGSSSSSTPGRKAVFLDRDGVINPQPSYRTGPQPFRLIPGVGQALARLARAGFALVIITNQTAVGRGFITRDMVAATNDKMASLLVPYGVELDGVYCRHHLPDAVVPQFRTNDLETKPSPAMLQEAARDLALNVGASFMVGDRLTDLQAGRNAGCRGTILVRTGDGNDTLSKLKDGEADVVADDLSQAADWVLAKS